MECYHEVGSVYHRISGSLQIGGVDFSLDGGRGYLEKDWGSSMPSAWIWMQCNGFSDPTLSFMLSVAKIPWMGKSFTGFLGYLVDGEREIPFGTYTNAKVSCESVTDREVVLTVTMKRYALSITASRERTGSLQAPLSGAMDRRIAESLDGAFHLRLFDREKDRTGRVLIDDTGFFGGLEVAGEPSELFPFKNTR